MLRLNDTLKIYNLTSCKSSPRISESTNPLSLVDLRTRNSPSTHGSWFLMGNGMAWHGSEAEEGLHSHPPVSLSRKRRDKTATFTWLARDVVESSVKHVLVIKGQGQILNDTRRCKCQCGARRVSQAASCVLVVTKVCPTKGRNAHAAQQ